MFFICIYFLLDNLFYNYIVIISLFAFNGSITVSPRLEYILRTLNKNNNIKKTRGLIRMILICMKILLLC